MTKTIALLLGSSRTSGNAKGLSAWVEKHFKDIAPAGYELLVLDPSSDPFPLGPVLDEVIPAGVRPGENGEFPYSSERTRRWSNMVRGFAGLIVLTPQFNWGIPGELKNSFDHLFTEWNGMNVVVITYGGHGGNKCAAQLQTVLGGGLDMKVVSCGEVMISMPGEYIKKSNRVEAPAPEWLNAYSDKLDKALTDLVTSSEDDLDIPTNPTEAK